MKLHQLENRKQTGYTTWGCVWKRGECPADSAFFCTGQGGAQVPVQSRITAYWPDGSAKWTAHTADSALLGQELEIRPAAPGENAGGVLPAGKGIEVEESEQTFLLKADRLSVKIDLASNELFEYVAWDGKKRLLNAQPVLLLEEPSVQDGLLVKTQRPYRSLITEVAIEEEGPLRVVVRYTGCHQDDRKDTKIPFIIRMKVSLNEKKLGFIHTFLYDGDEEKDYLKGLGLRFKTPMEGALYNRHVKFTGDYGVFHENVARLLAWRPRIPDHIYLAQNRGEKLEPAGEDKEKIDSILQAMPFWSEYDLCQDSVNHFVIRKKIIDDNCCYLDCLHGNRTEGGAAFGSEAGSVLLTIRDFWETYPSGITVRGLDTDTAEATVWLWSPKAEAMDFRHYANRGYNQVCYEGYDYKGATPYGIASTSEYTVSWDEKIIPSDEELEAFTEGVRHPAQYVGSPEYYHECRAFGYWSLPGRDTPVEKWLEEQLDKAFAFYKNEISQRSWYGLFNYGDFMHTYDPARHQWRYDIGGYAWDNTELVPTLWLWYYFLRTGREDVFTVAEKLCRHTSEVDVYHMGKYKGMGTRHNVRHWGCPCKEARIAMAAHHRVYYYMTGDYRLEDIFDELKDNEMTFLNKDPLGDFYKKEDMTWPSHARSGPDWSSLCANWMTQWERTQDPKYRDKITTGIADIKNTPLKLISGPDFEFDPATVHLYYIGERTTGGTHLQICMGAPQVWMEMADLLEDEEWKDMLADYGRFYFLPLEQRLKESGGLIGKRAFSYPMFASGIGAYGAARHNNAQEALRVWKQLLSSLLSPHNAEGFQSVEIRDEGNCAVLEEIPWISTNFTAQWCLNVIMTLDFIRQWIPASMEEAKALTAEIDQDVFRKG